VHPASHARPAHSVWQAHSCLDRCDAHNRALQECSAIVKLSPWATRCDRPVHDYAWAHLQYAAHAISTTLSRGTEPGNVSPAFFLDFVELSAPGEVATYG